MNPRALQAVCSQITQRFPEMRGVQPKVSDYPASQVLLVFKASAKTADGRAILRTVRVVASTDGKIAKITTSR